MPIEHEFQFQSHTANAQKSNVHPMELVVQAVVGDSLDALSTQLQTLHESQVVLIARLKVIEEKLRVWEVQSEVDVDVRELNETLESQRRRLTKVLERLSVIEERIKKSVK